MIVGEVNKDSNLFACLVDDYFIMAFMLFYTMICLLVNFPQRYTCAYTWMPVNTQPEQIHLSLGVNLQQMAVTWTTLNATNSTKVYFGTTSLNRLATGTQTKFVDGGTEKRIIYIHRVYMDGLTPFTSYKYHVGSEQGWSAVYQFRTLPAESNWSPRFAVYGDLGNTNPRTLGQVQTEVQTGLYDLVLHVGDFAYDMHDDQGRTGDAFMRQIESVAAYVPYQVCPGNHEYKYNFSHYENRFTMHSEGNLQVSNHFWSYNIGPVHVVSFSTEFHFFTEFGTDQIFRQYRWLEEDLRQANLPENRSLRPWIITIGHRPFYGNLAPVIADDEIIRKGNGTFPGFEDLFYKYGVDVCFFGHIHNYERMWPIYDNQVRNGSEVHPYTNPKAPVHITTGSAGCPEDLWRNVSFVPGYSARLVDDFGLTRLTVLNHSHLHLQQTAESQNGQVVDEIYVIKDKHGPQAWE